MRARRIRSGAARVWEEVAAAAPDAPFFATPAHAAILEEAGAPAPELFAFALGDGSRAVLPAWPRPGRRFVRTFQSPGGGLPGAILCDAPLTPARAEAVARALARVPDAAFHLTFEPASAPPLGPAPERSRRRDGFFVLDLEGGYAQVHAERFAKDFREQLRKAERRGVRTAFATDAEGFGAFGALHAAAAAAWDPQTRRPPAFFAACARAAAAPGAEVHLVLARSDAHEDRVVAGVLAVRRGATVTAWLAAMDRGARRLAPSPAAYAHLVEHACATGARRLLLGCSGGIASVEAFKRSLGATPVPCTYALEIRGLARQLARRTRTLRNAFRAAT
jgi:CelD/BcsL family acetyltransferase involved in cellulose biosynthesis